VKYNLHHVIHHGNISKCRMLLHLLLHPCPQYESSSSSAGSSSSRAGPQPPLLWMAQELAAPFQQQLLEVFGPNSQGSPGDINNPALVLAVVHKLAKDNAARVDFLQVGSIGCLCSGGTRLSLSSDAETRHCQGDCRSCCGVLFRNVWVKELYCSPCTERIVLLDLYCPQGILQGLELYSIYQIGVEFTRALRDGVKQLLRQCKLPEVSWMLVYVHCARAIWCCR
jgi:hypothetical protein